MKIVWLPRAVASRYEQLDYVAADDPLAAIRLDERIDAQIAHLREHPELGRAGRVPGTRELVLPRTSYVVVYRVNSHPARIEILHFLHGAQRWPKQSR